MQSTRAAILASARSTLASDPKASMAEIAKGAGVGRATLNRHLASREELLIELAMMAIDQCDRACQDIDYLKQPAIESLAQTLEAVAPLGENYAFLIAQPEVYAVPEIDAGLQRQRQAMLELIKSCQKEESLRPDLSPSWIYAICDALIYASWSEVSAGRLPKKRAGAQIFETLLSGCGPACTIPPAP